MTAALLQRRLVTAGLLFSQYVLLRDRSLLVLGCGYLFTAAMIVPHALTFPGLFAPAGLLGAGAKVWNPSTNAYQAGAWAPISFTYQQQANAAPVIAALGLVDVNNLLTTSTSTSQPVLGGQLTYGSA